MFTIREATISDIPLIRSLANVIFPHTYRELLSPEQIEFMMEWMYSEESLRTQMTNGHTFFIPEENGTPIGYLSVQTEDIDLYHLQKIYLHPTCQGKGYGKLLFQHAIDYVHTVHPAPCRMRLNVNRYNTSAVQFYQHMGMYKADEGDFHIGHGYYMTDYIMEIKVGERSVVEE